MNSKILVGASLFALTGFGGWALAESPAAPTQAAPSEQTAATVNQLEEARANVARNRQLGEHGMILIHDTDKQAELDRLIQRLQNGESVSPDEIDHAKAR